MSLLNNINRRRFLGYGACAAMGTNTFMNTLVNLMSTNALAGEQARSTNADDYKALVCILQAGGNDSFNMLAPKGDTEYAQYSDTRGGTDRNAGGIALTQDSIIELSNVSGDHNRRLGVNPGMQALADLYEAGDLAFIANVGTLIKPIANRDEYRNNSSLRPPGLFSHSDQQEQWQTSIANSRQEALGWGGKVADMLNQLNTDQLISMNISLSGKNLFQSGQNVVEYTINNSSLGGVGFETYPTWWREFNLMNTLRENTVKNLSGDVYNNIFKETMGGLTKQTIEVQERFATALQNAGDFTTDFPNNGFSRNLEQIAKVISINEALNVKRQIFFVSIGGWDNHNEVIVTQQNNLSTVSTGIAAFVNAIKEVGLEDKVTTFTVSDFARTLSSNGRGSDHAWGGNTMVAGGAVNGKKVYGSYPDLHIDGNPLNTDGRGRLIPTTSVDALFAELAIWFGVPKSRLGEIFPNLSEFYSISSSSNPIGFLPNGVPAIAG